MLVIHGIPLSVHTRKVIAAAELKGLDYRIEPVIPFNPPEGWTAISPTGLIPAIEDEGFGLSDSTAICAYLDRKHPDRPVFPREGAETLGRAAWFDAYAGGTLFRELVRPLFAQRVVQPKIRNQASDEAEVARLRAEVEPGLFGYLEGQAGAGYLVGDTLTIADLAVTSNLVNFHHAGCSLDVSRWPKLAAYFDRMVAEPALKAALAVEQPFAQSFGLRTDWAAREAA